MKKIVRAQHRNLSTDLHFLDAYVQHGDTESLGMLLAKYQQFAFATAMSVAGDPHIAEDAVQDAFVKIVKGAKHMRIHTSFRAYLAQAVLSCTKNCLSREAKLRDRQRNYAMDHAAFDPADDQALHEDVHDKILSALASLHIRYRIPITLCYIHGMSQHEAAQALGMKHATLRTRLSRGLDKLRKRMKSSSLALTLPQVQKVLSKAHWPMPSGTLVPAILAALEKPSPSGLPAQAVLSKTAASMVSGGTAAFSIFAGCAAVAAVLALVMAIWRVQHPVASSRQTLRREEAPMRLAGRTGVDKARPRTPSPGRSRPAAPLHPPIGPAPSAGPQQHEARSPLQARLTELEALIEERIQAIRDLGEPTTLEEILPPGIPDETNGAVALAKAKEALQMEYRKDNEQIKEEWNRYYQDEDDAALDPSESRMLHNPRCTACLGAMEEAVEMDMQYLDIATVRNLASKNHADLMRAIDDIGDDAFSNSAPLWIAVGAHAKSGNAEQACRYWEKFLLLHAKTAKNPFHITVYPYPSSYGETLHNPWIFDLYEKQETLAGHFWKIIGIIQSLRSNGRDRLYRSFLLERVIAGVMEYQRIKGMPAAPIGRALALRVLRGKIDAGIANLRTLSSAQAVFRSAGSGGYATLRQLFESMPPYIDRKLASGSKDGYGYDIIDVSKTAWAATATPEDPELVLAGYHFFVDTSGVVRVSTGGPAGPDSKPWNDDSLELPLPALDKIAALLQRESEKHPKVFEYERILLYLRIMEHVLAIAKNTIQDQGAQDFLAIDSLTEDPENHEQMELLEEDFAWMYIINSHRIEMTWLAIMENVMACYLYRESFAQFPDSLDDVRQQIHTHLPDDPCSGKGLRYHRAEDGFVLYSVGLDGIDQGGDERLDLVWKR